MTADQAQIVIWDWTIRLFHWLIVLLIPLMWWTAEEGMMDWHRRMGLTLFGLVIFRLCWGLIGTVTARFAPMVRQLGSLKDYVRSLKAGTHKPSFGHSPLAVLSVFALLGTLAIQVSTGLFTVDVDGLESGPLAVLVSFDTGRDFADIHELNFNILSGLIVLHLVAIAAYQWGLKANLVRPMITGRRGDGLAGADSSAAVKVHPLQFILAAAIALGCVYAVLEAG